MKLTIAMLLLLGTNVLARDDKPLISPYFDRIDDGPAFFVECRNTSSHRISSGADIWAWASPIRIDGAAVPESEGRSVPGLTIEVEPGGMWRGIIALRQSYRAFFPAVKFGALIRSARAVQLNQGRHTISVQCAGVWSQEFEFYWDSETPP